MDDDWDANESPAASGTSTPALAAPVAPRAPAAKKWAGEDEEEEQDDWDASEDEKPKPAGNVPAPAKKKMTLKQKLAEKERLAAERRERGEPDDELIDPLTEQERRRLAKERELAADLDVAADLLGVTGVNDPKETLEAILKASPKSKDDFATLSKQIMALLISRHQTNALYPSFAEQLARDLCEDLSAVQTRKVASGLSALGNVKQQEERDKASGKKKPASKPKLGAAKIMAQPDTTLYDDALDDGDDDFM